MTVRSRPSSIGKKADLHIVDGTVIEYRALNLRDGHTIRKMDRGH